MRESYRDHALVLRTYDFAEADRVIVLLTREHGVVRSVAKGVRRTRSRFGSRLQLFVELDVQLYQGRNLATITRADTITFLSTGIIEDVEKYTAACAVLETADRLSIAADPTLYDLVLESLTTIRTSPYTTPALDCYLLRAMSLAGWAPSLFSCGQCGRPGPHTAFHPEVGGAVCTECRPPGAAEVNPEVLHHMWLVERGHLEVPPQYASEVHQLTRAYLQWHVEQKLTSLAVAEGL